MTDYYLIDPPVSPYSPAEEIRAWLDELADMDQDNEQVKEAIALAQSWLDDTEMQQKTVLSSIIKPSK